MSDDGHVGECARCGEEKYYEKCEFCLDCCSVVQHKCGKNRDTAKRLHRWMSGDPEEVDSVLEWLEDNGFLTEEGKLLRKNYWAIFLQDEEFTSNPDEVIRDRRENMDETIPHEEVKKRVLADVEDTAVESEGEASQPDLSLMPGNGSAAASENKLEPAAWHVKLKRKMPDGSIERREELFDHRRFEDWDYDEILVEEQLVRVSDVIEHIQRFKDKEQLPGWVKRLLCELMDEFSELDKISGDQR